MEITHNCHLLHKKRFRSFFTPSGDPPPLRPRHPRPQLYLLYACSTLAVGAKDSPSELVGNEIDTQTGRSVDGDPISLGESFSQLADVVGVVWTL
jgi:hypothetical protein